MTIFTPKTRENLHCLFHGSLSQSIGRGRISREGALDHRESRERRDKIFAAKTENAKIFKKKMDQENSFQCGDFAISNLEFSFFWPREN